MRAASTIALCLVLIGATSRADVDISFGESLSRKHAERGLQRGFGLELAEMEVVTVADADRATGGSRAMRPENYRRWVREAIETIDFLLPVPLDDASFGEREKDLANVGRELALLSELQPDDPVPYYYRGVAAIEVGELERAIPHLEKARELGLADLRIFRLLTASHMQRPRRVVEITEAGLRVFRDRFLLVRRGIALFALRRFDDAIGALNSALAMQRDDGILILTAVIHMETDRYAEATAILENLRSRKPRDKEVLSALYEVHRSQGHRAESEALARLLVETYPDDPEIQALLEGTGIDDREAELAPPDKVGDAAVE